MPHDPPVAPLPPSERYELEVSLEAPGRAWAAVLVVCASGTQIEFDHPLALLRFLARHSFADRRGGLR